MKDESEATLRPALRDTSPADTTEPVKDGDARGALRARVLVNPVLTIVPPTYKLALKDESEATLRPALRDTSPDDVTMPVKDGDARGAFNANPLVNPGLFIVPPT